MKPSSVEDRLSELERRVSLLESPNPPKPSGASAAKNPTLSPREFLLQHKLKSDTDRTLAAVFYLEKFEGQDSANFDEIDSWFSAAKEAAPVNRRDPPYQLVKKGYLREVGKREVGKTARNRWAVTNLGIARVESGFKTK